MKTRAPGPLPAVLLLLALALAGCAGVGPTAREVEAPPPRGSDAEIEALYRARLDSARLRFTPADVRFVTGMIGHHAQALIMSELAPARTTTPSLRTLAARIINAQNDEIALMERWLEDRGQPVPEVHREGTTLMIHGAGHEGPMPGMLSEEQMRRLEEARGGAFDRLFLAFMIQHHQGAVAMVDELFGSDGAAQDEAVFKLASDIQVDQTTEVARMELMLAELPPGDGPAGAR